MFVSCCRLSYWLLATLLVPLAFSSQAESQSHIASRLLNRHRDQGPVESSNFVVYANDRLLGARVSQAAERYRKSLAAEWLGRELPTWQQKCPIKVTVEPHAGGETSFAFMTDSNNQVTPVDWDMKIYGPPDRLLDAVLPHEITHAIFATHFRRPLPRWADEGACTTVEHVSEQQKNHRMLMEFLNTSRGIPFNRMFSLKQYPRDILPLYAQGFSVAKFLIFQKGKRHFLNFIAQGMHYEDHSNPVAGWNRATQEFYSFDDLSDLQLAWVAWVRGGSDKQSAENLAQPLRVADNRLPAAKASLGQAPATEIVTIPPDRQTRTSIPAAAQNDNRIKSLLLDSSNVPQLSSLGGTFASTSDSWYASQMRRSPQTQTVERLQSLQTRRIDFDRANVSDASDTLQPTRSPIVHESSGPADLN